MRWSKGADGGGLESEENSRGDEKEIKTELGKMKDFAFVVNRVKQGERKGPAQTPRNKVDQNSSMPMSHYLLCQLCLLTC